jgi:hypothetical protein
MLGIGLPVSMCTTKTSINMWRFNVPELKEFLTHKRQISNKIILFVLKTSIHRQLLL